MSSSSSSPVVGSPVVRPPVAGPGRPKPLDINERRPLQLNGFLGLLVALVLAVAAFYVLVHSAGTDVAGEVGTPSGGGITGAVLLGLGTLLALGGIVVVQPGQRLVLQFLGAYVGTVSRTGLVWTWPLTTRRRISIRVRAIETAHLKVNDADGNPVEIAGIIVWQVDDTAKATFAVENVESFVAVQAEAALRHIARSYPYDGPNDVESLRGSTEVLAQELAAEVRERVAAAGVHIVEVRISHLAYAPEIAQAMLQRQQAAAVVAARGLIVQGAVGIVQNALTQLSEQGVVVLDDERRAAMVSNLLVVLCGESRAQPVVNAGTLYS
jgi:regulator of protease activity HflC (stomatin/prohibitin superfamily)